MYYCIFSYILYFHLKKKKQVNYDIALVSFYYIMFKQQTYPESLWLKTVKV